MFVAWLVSTILAVGTTVAWFLLEIKLLIWIFISLWIVDLILFFGMNFSWITKLEKIMDRDTYVKTTFVTSLIATVVTLALIFFVRVFKLPIWVLIASGCITFVAFCFFFYMLSDNIDTLIKAKEAEEEERRRQRNNH